MKRVLHVLNELRPSGAETMLRSAAAFWKGQDIELHILATGECIGPYQDRLVDAGYTIHHIPFAKSASFFLKLAHFMKNNSWDVVHIHTERANFYYGLIARLTIPARVLRTIHSSFEFTGLLRLRRMVQRRLLAAMGVRHVAISEEVRSIEKKHFGLDCELIFNWFDSEHFRLPNDDERTLAKQNLGFSPDSKVFVIVGNCSPIKNHEFAIEEMARLQHLDWSILHVGIEAESKSERQLAQTLGIDQRIRFVGGVNDVRPYLWAADYFLMPSRREGFGIAMLEAIVCGAYPIAANVPGLRGLAGHFSQMETFDLRSDSFQALFGKVYALAPEVRVNRMNLWSQLAAQTFGIASGAGAYSRLYLGK